MKIRFLLILLLSSVFSFSQSFTKSDTTQKILRTNETLQLTARDGSSDGKTQYTAPQRENIFPYAGKSFKIQMDNGLEVINTYHKNGKDLKITFLNTDLKGTVMDVPFNWRHIDSDNYLISWQERDLSTVVHLDNFKLGKSYAYYTTMKGNFYVMTGVLTHNN